MSVSVTVYCGASEDLKDTYLQLAYDIGQHIAQRDWRLIYGGSTLGMMGACAEGALSKGGHVTGITLNRFRNFHNGLDELISVETMRERKKLLSEKSNALIALPGGLGTLEELTEIMVERSYTMHQKPLILINLGGFWDALLKQIDEMRQNGFIVKPDPFKVANTIDDAFEYLENELTAV